MRCHPSFIGMALGLSLAACSAPQPMQPEAMAQAVEKCHKLGLRAEEMVSYSGAASDWVVVTGIQCRTVVEQ